MTALLFELERTTPTSVITPVMHATMTDSIKNCLPRLAFRPREASSYCVTTSARPIEKGAAAHVPEDGRAV